MPRSEKKSVHKVVMTEGKRQIIHQLLQDVAIGRKSPLSIGLKQPISIGLIEPIHLYRPPKVRPKI